MDKYDWQGKPVPESETPDTKILVWVITPGMGGFDEIWVRDWQRAISHAQDILEDSADEGTEADLLEHGVSVRMQLRRTTVREYEEVCANEA